MGLLYSIQTWIGCCGDIRWQRVIGHSSEWPLDWERLAVGYGRLRSSHRVLARASDLTRGAYRPWFEKRPLDLEIISFAPRHRGKFSRGRYIRGSPLRCTEKRGVTVTFLAHHDEKRLRPNLRLSPQDFSFRFAALEI